MVFDFTSNKPAQIKPNETNSLVTSSSDSPPTGMLAGVSLSPNADPPSQEHSKLAEDVTIPPVTSSAPSLPATFSQHPSQPTQFEDEHVQQFKKHFTLLLEHMQEPQVVGQLLRRIMIDLSTNPHYSEVMAPEDAGAMVRAARISYGRAVETKKTSKKKKKPAIEISSEGLGDLASQLRDIQFS